MSTSQHYDPQSGQGSPSAGDQMATDPVCGELVDTRTSPYTANYMGVDGQWRTFYFSSDECKQLFEANPEQYAKDLP